MRGKMAPSAVIVGQALSHYRILEPLGTGGMGEVYRARDTQLERDVAIKILPAASIADPTAKARLLREARTASLMNHPNICTIHEVGEAAGETFIVMEVVEGEPLKAKLRKGPLPADLVLRYSLQLTDAVAHAHQHNVIHRDLKSANIMITPEGRVKVLDFGLARRAVEPSPEGATESQISLNQPGAVVGTLAYMAPEQLRGNTADARSDVWALGVVLYEMLAGRLPFQGETRFEMGSVILQKPAQPLPSNTPARLCAVVERCLEKEPARRYQSGGEMQVALESIQSGTASFGGARYRPSRRQWLVASVVVFIAVAISAGLKLGRLRARFGTPRQPESLAVLPLKNLMADPQQNYFVDGMQEALITELSKASALKVISRPSTLRYRETDKSAPQIARELGVDVLLEGSVMREGQRVRISLQLVEGASDKNLWAQSFDRELRGILDLQSQVARQVKDQIKVTITPAEAARLARSQPVDPESYQLYLRGRYFWYQRNEEAFRKALQFFSEAIEKDPTYAPPYAGLAYTYEAMSQELYEVVPPEEANPKITAALKKALELDESLADAHVVLAYVKFRREFDWQGAEEEFQRALALNSSFVATHFWYSHYLLPLGRKEESLAESRRALELDPFSQIANTHLGWNYLYLRQYHQAEEQLRKTVELDQNFALAHMFLGQTYEQERMYPQAITELEMAARLSGGLPVYLASLAHAYSISGNTVAARKVLYLLQDMAKTRYVPSYEFAVVYTGLGDREQALHWLERAYEIRDSGWLVDMNVDPRLQPLHSHPRFQALLLRMKLPNP